MFSNTPHDNEPDVQATTIIRWRCPNCGQTLFTAPDESPPDMCAYCDDFTTWQKLDADDQQNSQ
jgi:rubrerythrin